MIKTNPSISLTLFIISIFLPILGGARHAHAWTEPVRIIAGTGTDARTAVAGRNIYVVDWVSGRDFDFIRSTDNGRTWSEPVQPADTFYGAAEMPDIEYAANGLIHLVWVGQYEGIFRFHVFHQSSSDGGRHWSRSHQVFNNAADDAYYPSLSSKGDTLFVAFMKFEGIHVFRSFDSGITWQDSSIAEYEFWSSRPTILYSQGRLHLVYALNISQGGVKVYYSQSDDLGLTWTPRIYLSSFEPIAYHSQRPFAYADENGNIVAVWFDYQYGSMCGGVTGDILGRISTDNGETWLSETRLTYTQSGRPPSCDIIVDSVVVAWADGYPLNCVHSKVSYAKTSDWGWSWTDPLVISGDIQVSEFAPFIFHSYERGEAMIHCLYYVVDPPNGGGIYYVRSKPFYSDRKPIPGPEPVILKVNAYPNVFNSTTAVNFENSEGGDAELEIFDVNGKMVWSQSVSGKEGSLIWNAMDSQGAKVCSGIYFIRIRTTEAEKTIKLILLK